MSQMHAQVRELARQYFTDQGALAHALGELDSELQESSGLQERGNHLQGALRELQGEEAMIEEASGREEEGEEEDTLQIAY